jgi:hypothetical protein
VNHGPDGCRQRVQIGAGEGAPDERVDVFGDGGARSDPFAAVTVTRIAEHCPEKRRVFERELDVGDGDGVVSQCVTSATAGVAIPVPPTRLRAEQRWRAQGRSGALSSTRSPAGGRRGTWPTQQLWICAPSQNLALPGLFGWRGISGSALP